MGPPLVIAFPRRYLSVLVAIVLLAAMGPAGCERSPAGGQVTEAEAAVQAAGEGLSEGTISRPRGLWVLCEGSQRPLEDLARLSPLLDTAVAQQAGRVGDAACGNITMSRVPHKHGHPGRQVDGHGAVPGEGVVGGDPARRRLERGFDQCP